VPARRPCHPQPESPSLCGITSYFGTNGTHTIHRRALALMNRLFDCHGENVFTLDPQVDPEVAIHECGLRLIPFDGPPRADVIVAAVAHRSYAALGVEDLCRKVIRGGAVIDVKAAFDPLSLKPAGLRVWRL
jgi:hypothetical protein